MFDEFVEDFVQSIKDKSYNFGATTRARLALDFCGFLKRRRYGAAMICRDTYETFLRTLKVRFRRTRCQPISKVHLENMGWIVKLFLKFLHARGKVRVDWLVARKHDAVPGFEALLAEYTSFLKDHKGLAESTISKYVYHASLLCRRLKDRGKTFNWNGVTPEFLYAFQRKQARKLGFRGMKNLFLSLRTFFKFLHQTGRTKIEAYRYLVNVRNFNLSSVPKVLDLEDIHKLLNDTIGTTPTDRKDRAVLLLLILYGLRISEVGKLTLDDIKWEEKQITVRKRKSRRDLHLPLHPAIARALYWYIHEARPRNSPHRQIFLTLNKWAKPYNYAHSVWTTILYRIQRLGLKMNPHAFRHTVASQLINNDCPPEWIQSLLGQRTYSSTRIYAKVDLAHLREVADNYAVNL